MYKLNQNSALITRLADSANIPADPTNTDYASYLKWLAAGNTPEPAAASIPSSLSMRQARLALLGAGLLDAVQAGILAMPQAAQIEWDYATTVERSSPLVATLAASLGLTSEALDALFTAGAAL